MRRTDGIGDHAGGDADRLVLDEQPEDRQARALGWDVGAEGTITPPFPKARQGPGREGSPQPWMLGCRL